MTLLMNEVSVLFSEPKIPQTCRSMSCPEKTNVSVLFSEPKIPQIESAFGLVRSAGGFSALQRAENSSNIECCDNGGCGSGFQCSSASRKFLKDRYADRLYRAYLSFSALQRAENSSKGDAARAACVACHGFSALQRAENSSNEMRRRPA